MNKELSVGSVFTKVWESFKASRKTLGMAWLVVIAINFVLSFLNSRTHDGPSSGFIMFAFGILSTYVLTRLSIMAVRGQVFDLKTEALNINWMKVLMFLGLSVLFGVAVGVGMVLLVVPGIIVAIRFMLSSYALLDEDLDIIESAKRSLEMTRGHGWDLFLIGLVFFLVSIFAGFITLSLVSFVVMPAQILVGAVIYERLRNNSLPKKEDVPVPVK